MTNSFLNRANNFYYSKSGRICSHVEGALWCTTVSGLLLFCFTKPAWAYIDFGIGSMVVQLFLGGIAGALVIIKFYWARIKEWFFKIVRKGKPEGENPTLPEGGEE